MKTGLEGTVQHVLQYVQRGADRSSNMYKKLTITVDAEVYDGLLATVGRRRISRFLSDLARPHVTGSQNLAAGYAAMAADLEREREAEDWVEGLVGDTGAEPPGHA